ncbi:VOC family protein [Streptomyces sp. TRM 70361]|uniref:VOC family protein n=1 Tax=Streptomyces sp. TRM 70361 TaxID=3116553 RepID=UPI002E7B944B|nr:VOC family protein [Streptomyces sp. TRM 70361]MEE1942436.1 VOC family protein [Streptomyces sp. TRM 70361]
MPVDGRSQLRVARPSRGLAAAERFWARGLGLDVLYRAAGERPGEHDLLMLGWPDAAWHLELVHDPDRPVLPRPTEEDLLVVYLGGAVPAGLVARLTEHGGRRVASSNPYWDRWGVTVEDPDGYRLVLCERGWSSS